MYWPIPREATNVAIKEDEVEATPREKSLPGFSRTTQPEIAIVPETTNYVDPDAIVWVGWSRTIQLAA